MRTLLLLLLAGAAAAAPNIVGGRPTDITEVPWQLELDWNVGGWVFECGASILGPNTVITAGHCVQGLKANQIRVRSGQTNIGEGDVHIAKTIIPHPDYTETPGERIPVNDVAILVVNEPFAYSDSVQPINITKVEPKKGDQVLVSGWGDLNEGGPSPKHLQSVIVPIVDRKECNNDYGGNKISDDMMCAGLSQGGKDSCQGDSGGPVVMNGELVGIVSWGNGCAEPGYPGVYTNVAYFKDWIAQQKATIERH